LQALRAGKTGRVAHFEPPDWLAGWARRGNILHRVSTAFRNLIAFIS
jgi:hypothetical protein